MNAEIKIERGQVWEDFDRFNNMKGKVRQWIVIGAGEHQVVFMDIDGSQRGQSARWHFTQWHVPVGNLI